MEFEQLITLTQISDGAPGEPGAPGRDGDKYYIETNQEEIWRFQKIEGLNENIIYEVSPKILTIRLYELPLEAQLDFSNRWIFGFLNENDEFQQISEDYLSFGQEVLDPDNDTDEEIFITSDPLTLYFYIENYINSAPSFQKGNIILKFAYLDENNKEIAIKIIPLRDGVSSEMARFNIEATKINAAVRDSYLEFDETGLSLCVSGEDEGLKIYKKNAETKDRIFWADGQGNLNIKGNIYADSGVFNGTVHATYADFEDGEIGGFKITNNSLTSLDSSLVLKGSEGIIEANTIKLGKGAEIVDYISFSGFALTKDLNKIEGKTYYRVEGNDYVKVESNEEIELKNLYEETTSYIKNPSKNSNEFISANGIQIKADGTALFGNIKVDGVNSILSGTDWTIGSDWARFNNVSVSGTIETAVFNTATTQTVGSTMVFMQSYKIEDIQHIEEETDENKVQKTQIIVDHNFEENTNQGVLAWLIKGDDYHQCTIEKTESNIITLTNKITIEADEIPTIIAFIGKEEDKPLVFGINSSNTKTANNLLYPHGLTITELGKTDLPHIFLGDLSQLSAGYDGYGLYGSNVYLTGSLTTKVGQDSYAGVNTLNGVPATIFNKEEPKIDDSSNIVFWAGAKSTSKGDIQSAHFQVTEQGSVYASQAKLTNSLFAGGVIRGTEIYTSKIHGTIVSEDKSEPALIIYDTSQGISFREKSDDGKTDKETFNISANGLTFEGKPIFDFSDSKAGLVAEKIKLNNPNNFLSLEYSESIPGLVHRQGENSCGFYFGSGATSFKMNNINRFNITTNLVELDGDVGFYQQGGKLLYSSVNGGYDLFVE